MRAPCLVLTLPLWVGCGDGGATVSAPPEAAATAPTVEVTPPKDGRTTKLILPGFDALLPDPAPFAELSGLYPRLATLPEPQQNVVVGMANSIPAPCGPCADASMGRCAVAVPEGCENIPLLMERLMTVAAAGRSPTEARDAVLYDDIWLPLEPPPTPWGGSGSGPSVEMWVDPASPFLAPTVETLDGLALDGIQLSMRVLLSDDGASTRAVATGALAAERQGLALEFLQAASAWRQQAREAVRRGDDPFAGDALEGIALDLESKGLDLTRWRTDRSDPSLAARLDADQAYGPSIGVRAVPTWFINGYRLRGAQSADALARVLLMETDPLAAASARSATTAP